MFWYVLVYPDVFWPLATGQWPKAMLAKTMFATSLAWFERGAASLG